MEDLQGLHGEHLTPSRCYTTSRDTAFKAMIDHLSDWLPLTEIEGIDGKVM